MKYRVTLLFLIALLSVSACQPEAQEETTSAKAETNVHSEKSPQEVLKSFLDAYVVKRDLPGAYQYFSKADQQAKSQAEYVKDKTQPELEELFKKSSRYEIKQSEVGAQKATFRVDIQSADVQKLFQAALGGKSLLELASMKKEDASRLADQNLAKYKEGKTPIPMMTQTQEIVLLKEDGQWRVFVDWAQAAKDKQAQNPVLGIGGQGVVMSDPAKGQVMLKVNSVKFTSTKAKPDMILCIVNVSVSNQMKDQFTEALTIPLANAEIYAQGGNKYKRDLAIYDPDLIKDVDIVNPLNPGKTVSGDIAFQVDKGAKDLKLTFDAGYSPLPNNYDHSEGKSLSFKLGNVSL